MVDIITNSSSEIYIFAGDSTVKAVKELVDNLLKGVGSEKTADDLFVFEVVTEIDNPKPRAERLPGEGYYIEVPVDSPEGKEAIEEYRGDFGKETSIRVTAKAGTPESISVAASPLSNLTGLCDMDSSDNG